MKVTFTGRHVGVEHEDRDYAFEKIEALARFHKHIIEVEVRVEKDGAHLERVELDAGIGHHHRVAAEALYSFLTETRLTRAALTSHGSEH